MAHDGATAPTERRRLGDWLPRSEAHLARYRLDLAEKAKERAAKAPRDVVVDDLSALISGDPVLRMDLARAIGAAHENGYVLGYESIEELMIIVDYLMAYAPPFSETGLIHCPLNAVLDWPMCMPSGYALFCDPALNAQLKRVLNCGNILLRRRPSRRIERPDVVRSSFGASACFKNVPMDAINVVRVGLPLLKKLAVLAANSLGIHWTAVYRLRSGARIAAPACIDTHYCVTCRACQLSRGNLPRMEITRECSADWRAKTN